MIRKRERKGGNNIKSSWELSTSIKSQRQAERDLPVTPDPASGERRPRVSFRVLLSTLPTDKVSLAILNLLSC